MLSVPQATLIVLLCTRRIFLHSIDKVWKGPHPEDGQEVFVQDDPPEGGQAVDHLEEPSVFAPGYHPGEFAEIAQRMMREGGKKTKAW